MDLKPVVFFLFERDEPLANAIAAATGGTARRPAGKEIGEALRTAFREGRAMAGIFSSGIIIRHLADCLADKHLEPPVIAISADGASVIPLLGGHRGANRLAQRIAAVTGGHCALTTASDVHFGVALDDPPSGYRLANPEHVKSFAARLIGGATVEVIGKADWLAPLPQAPDSELKIRITEERAAGSDTCLVYHPTTLAVGLGCERGTTADEMVALIHEVLDLHGLAPEAVACFASIDLKADETGMHRAVARFSAEPLRFFRARELSSLAPRLRKPSDIVLAETGTPGVAEAAALAAAGPVSELLVEKTKSRRATCAIAKALAPITAAAGKPQGRLHVVGIGPGNDAWRSPAATAALETSSHWVGYGLYLDLAASLRTGQQEHRFPLGDEEMRARKAIALAAEGLDVALVCSGDAGIYAMAALVYEVLDKGPVAPAEARIAVNVIPGISAFQAAAARAGALIGHDFCCISLSDLLTPWPVIEQRIAAAAAGDFVTALYNPRSLKRSTHLDRAMALLRLHRDANTPVVVASNLGRPDERVSVVRLADFDPEQVDMLTIVLVGASQSRIVTRGDGASYTYTPRGYARKWSLSA